MRPLVKNEQVNDKGEQLMHPEVLRLIERDLDKIIEWAQQERAYVQRGCPQHPEGKDATFYYRYIRTVATSF